MAPVLSRDAGSGSRAPVDGDHALVFTDGPEVELKGLSGAHRLHELLWKPAEV